MPDFLRDSRLSTSQSALGSLTKWLKAIDCPIRNRRGGGSRGGFNSSSPAAGSRSETAARETVGSSRVDAKRPGCGDPHPGRDVLGNSEGQRVRRTRVVGWVATRMMAMRMARPARTIRQLPVDDAVASLIVSVGGGVTRGVPWMASTSPVGAGVPSIGRTSLDGAALGALLGAAWLGAVLGYDPARM